MGKAVFQQSSLPTQDSELGKKLAKELWEKIKYFQDARRERDDIVQQCDEAYLCHRYVPDTGAIELIEDGEFGESDIFDNMNMLSIRQALTLMPRNERWLAMSGQEDEDDEYVRMNEDYQMFLHRKARTRRQIQRHMKQKNVRGRSGIYWEWEEEIVWRKLGRTENKKAIKKFLQASGLSEEDAHRFSTGKMPEVIRSGPVIVPIDYFDLWLDPLADLVITRRPAMVVRRYFQLQQLKDARDELSEKDLYELPEDFEATPVRELMDSQQHRAGRAASERLFGRMPLANADRAGKLVPVYIFYVPYIEVDGHKFYDTYFHLATSPKHPDAVIIRVEENPSDLGLSHIMIDDCIDWFTPTAGGGISLVEKQLSKLNQKNLLQLLTVTAAASSIFPAQQVVIDKIRGGIVNFGPGAINYTDEYAGDVIKPVPTPAQGTQLGETLLRFYADDMRAASGVDGMVADNVSRTLQKQKTATEITRDASSGNLVLDNAAENDSEFLTDLCQAIYETSQKRTVPNNANVIEYERYLGDRLMTARMPADAFKVKRSLQVVGASGAINREQELNNILKGLEVAGLVSQTLGPQIVPFIYTGFLKAWRRLGIPMPDEVQENPAAIVATNPQVQQAALEQAQLNPQMQLLQGGVMNEQAGQAFGPY